MKTILVLGNPVDGFTFIGPFDDLDTAIAYADFEFKGETWWEARLQPPEVDNPHIRKKIGE